MSFSCLLLFIKAALRGLAQQLVLTPNLSFSVWPEVDTSYNPDPLWVA